MPIVINEFEVMVEPSESSGSKPRESQTEQAAPLGPDEILAVIQLNNERLERVRSD